MVSRTIQAISVRLGVPGRERMLSAWSLSGAIPVGLIDVEKPQIICTFVPSFKSIMANHIKDINLWERAG